MKDLLAKIIERWTVLATRERRILVGGLGVASLLISYVFFYAPLLERNHLLRKKINTDQHLVAWMKAADTALRGNSSKKVNVSVLSSPIELLSAMQKQIQQINLSEQLTELKQSAGDGVELHFKKVDFDKVMSMLSSISSEYNVMISQMTVKRKPQEAGMVSADIYLKLTN